MSRCRTRTVLAFVIAALTWGHALTVWANTIEVRLSDGRLLRGSVVESQTDANQLVLEQRASGITLRRSLPWNHVASWRLIPLAKRIPPHAVNRSEAKVVPDVATAEVAATKSQTVARIEVQAEPLSTQRKMEWDALRLSLWGVDSHGDDAPLFGTLRVTLWGLRQEPARLDQNQFGPLYGPVPRGIEKLATWTRPVDSEIVRPANATTVEGAVPSAVSARPNDARSASIVTLPLPRPLPEHDSRLAAVGEVSVELLMPGVGVFEAAAAVSLSHESPLRQYRLMRDGTRFFKGETTSDSQQPFGDITNRALWPERRVLTIQP